MLLIFSLHWIPPIIISFLYLVLSFQLNIWTSNEVALQRCQLRGSEPILSGFPIFDSLARIPLSVWSAIWRRSSQAWKHSFHNLSFVLLLTNLGLITFILLLPTVRRKLAYGTGVSKLLNLAFYISLLEVVTLLFLALPKNPLSVQTAVTFPILFPPTHCAHSQNLSKNYTFSTFPPFIFLYGTITITSINKAEPFSQRFVLNSILEDSSILLYPPFSAIRIALKKRSFCPLCS